ncbi:helix-turn-helix domain-containing protein [Aliarcobacter butzleri]
MSLLTIIQALKKYQYLNEKTILNNKNLSADSSVQITFVKKDGKKEISTPAKFDFYIMILCLTGGSIRKVAQYEYNIKEYSLQLIPCGAIHSFHDIYEDTKYYTILFEKNFCSEIDILNFHNEHFDHVDLDLEVFDKIKKLYEEIEYELVNDQKYSITYVRNVLIQILIILKREKLKKETKKSRADLICRQFLSLVEIHFNLKRTISCYSKLMGLSSKHLSETLKKELGKSALHFIHERILKEAKYLLIFTDKSISIISNDLNFQNISQFTRFFKRNTGISPKKYRIENSIEHINKF